LAGGASTRIVTLLALASVLVLGGAGAQGANGLAGVCAESSHESGCKVEPTRIQIGASSEVRSLEWKSWGGARAIGIGTLYSPAINGEQARIKLYRLVTCGKTWYSRATVRYGMNYQNTHIQGYPFSVC
jgi:hypothetical protein